MWRAIVTFGSDSFNFRTKLLTEANLFHPAQAPPPGLEAQRRQGFPLLQVGVAAGLASIPQLSGGVPKGYLRLVVFDQDSALAPNQPAPVQLSQAANGGYERLSLQLVLPQDGYVTAYVGNESDVDVLFDDVSVEHRPGLLVQETQYDPAGLELAGLVAPSPGIRGLNNYRFNGKEFQADLGLGWNHQDWRFLDPQLLRWHSVDPEIENGQESWTPYSFGYDNAVRYADANGRVPGGPGDPPAGGVLPAPGMLQQLWNDLFNPSDLRHTLNDLRDFPLTGLETNLATDIVVGLQSLANLSSISQAPPAPTPHVVLPSDRAHTLHTTHAGSQATSQVNTTSSTRPAARVGQVPHKNSLSSNATQHGYRILNKNGEVMEYGISAQKLTKKGDSPRIASKLAEKYGNTPGYYGEVLNSDIQPTRVGQTAREAATEWEQTQVDNYAAQNPTGAGPPRQVLPRPSN